MKTKRILFILAAAVFLISGIISVYLLFLRPKPEKVRITSDGETLYVLEPAREEDRLITVEYEGRENVIEIKDGRVHMLKADCPDHICIETGWLDNGLPIICLPNRLVIEYEDGRTDAAAG